MVGNGIDIVMKRNRKALSASLRQKVLKILLISIVGFFWYSPVVGASKYSCGSYGAGDYQSGRCSDGGLLAPLTGISAPILGIVGVAGIGGGASLLLATKNRRQGGGGSER